MPHLAADYQGKPARVGALQLPGRVRGDFLELSTADDGFQPRFWPGVNLGSTVPGRFPGELAQTRADYRRWLPEMASLGTRALRVYTILPPAFYEELRRYNLAHPAAPVYVIHGAWIPEDRFMETGNAYDRRCSASSRRSSPASSRSCTATPTCPSAAGTAQAATGPTSRSGCWRGRSASNGTRWRSAARELNPDVPAYPGATSATSGKPNAMESWIASHLDYVAGLEAKRGWSRPITFTNWLTADPLRHPSEPLDPGGPRLDRRDEHARDRPRWPAGFFASYHVYPYYPEFLRLEKSYQTYKRPDGKVDPYAGYLHDLKAHHKGQAVMVTEFGQPSALGIAHTGPLGRNQGGHSEAQSAAKNADLMSAIRQEGFAGGLVFEWADEWFKFTWNTKELEVPEHRGAVAQPAHQRGALRHHRRRDRQRSAQGHRRRRRQGMGAPRPLPRHRGVARTRSGRSARPMTRSTSTCG